jgi:hypothetical protein
MAETVGLKEPCDLVHKDKTPRVLSKIPDFQRKFHPYEMVASEEMRDLLAAALQHVNASCLLLLAAQLLKVTAYAWDQRVTTVP